MDQDLRNRVDSSLRMSPDPARLVLFDSIPGYDIIVADPDPPPAVFPAVIQNASFLWAALISTLITVGNTFFDIVLAWERAQAPASGDIEEEDYGNEEDEDEVEDEVEDEIDTNPQKEEPVQEVTSNYDAEVGLAAQQEAAVVYRRPEEQEDRTDKSNTVLQHEDVDPPQEGHASNTSSATPDRIQAAFKSTTSPDQNEDGGVALEISPTAIQCGVDATEAGAALHHRALTSSCFTTTLEQDQVAEGAGLGMTSNIIAASTEALESPGPESIKEEPDAVCHALQAMVARPPGTGGAHSPNPALEFQVFPVKPEVKTGVGSSLDPQESRMASTAFQKELELVTASHESSSCSTASSSS